ncbi:hypothetical protein [Sphingomonas sp. UYEF23]|uniref:hypothetical protein n=1 Tax=Sphingomonas sp. UYEF23 TaxID=1756408 RepID=UPI0033912729
MADVAALRQPTWNGQGSLSDWLADNCGCAVCVTSNPDRTGPRVMSSIIAHPDESLVSLIARASAENWLPRLRAILSTASPTWHAHFNLAAREDFDFGQLAFAARLPPHEVEARRYRRSEMIPDLPIVGFHGASVPVYDLNLKPRRVTTSWLKSGYHSAFGHHALVTHCPATGELLFDKCPRCSTALTWTKSAITRCTACGLDIADHEGERVSRRTLAATRLMLDIIHPHPARHSEAMADLHTQLAGLDRGLVFELGWRMGCVLVGVGLGGRDEAARLPIDVRLKVLEAGSSVLSSWPESLYEALKGRIAGSTVAPSTKLAGQIREILTAKNCWPSLREVLHQAVPGLKWSAGSAVKSVLELGVNSGELQQTLGVSQKVLDRLRVTPHLTAVRSSGEVNSHEIFEAAGLQDLKVLLDDRVSVGSIAERLDISRHGVEQLACLGFIKLFDHGPLRSGFLARQAKRSDYLTMMERLNKSAIDEPDHGEAKKSIISIDLALKVIGGREKPWGPVIAAMLNGTLPFYLDRSNEDRFMGRVSIAAGDVRLVAGMRFKTDNFAVEAIEFEPLINGRDAEELLNIFPKYTRAARLDRSLPPFRDKHYDRATILELATKHITASEILARWNGRDKKMPKPFVGRRGLRKLNTLGWDRIAAERAMTVFHADSSAHRLQGLQL